MPQLRLSLPVLRRQISSTANRKLPLKTGPSPPRLPEQEQKVFEDLQRRSTGAFSTPRPAVNQSPHAEQPQAQTVQAVATETPSPASAKIRADGDGEELHPDVRRGAAPEFEGDKNPKTGEVGGPKNEPLRWGANADWSYNGRVTDF